MKSKTSPIDTFDTVGAASGGSFIIDPVTGKATPNPADFPDVPSKAPAEERSQATAEDQAQKKVK